MTVRFVSEQSGASLGTLSGWFGGQHVPEKASEGVLAEVLAICGVRTQTDVRSWLEAARRVRSRRRSGQPVGEPYRGLESFRVEDSDWFFGRADIVEQVVRRVRQARSAYDVGRVIVVTGASGSGKSSILNAGVVPVLQADGVTIASITPKETPARSIGEHLDVDVLVIDQFEELWSECGDPSERQRALAELARPHGGPVIVIGLRADYFDRARREPSLREPLAAAIPVSRLVGSAVRSVVVEPARRAGWAVDEDLLHLLLIEFTPSGGRSALDDGALALLSHALLETWRHSTGRRMTVADYVATGGIAGAVHRTAETVYGELTEEQRVVARRVLLRLIVIDDSTVLRRRATHAEIFADDARTVQTVVEKFARNRLVTVEREYVEITHETLISAWSRLGDWVAADREAIIAHRRLARATLRWRRTGDIGALFGPGELAEMWRWQPGGDRERELNRFERDFLAAGRAQQDSRADRERRGRRRTRRLIAALAVVTVLAVALTATVVRLHMGITQERQVAERARDEATARGLAAEANDLRETDPALAAQLALAAFHISPTVETRSALLEATAAGTPVRWIGPAGEARLAMRADGRLAALGFEDGSIQLVTVDPRPAIGEVARATVAGSVSALAFDPAGRLLAIAVGGRIELWDVTDPSGPYERAHLASGGPTVTNFAFAPDGTQLVAATTSTVLLRWDLSDPARPERLAASRTIEPAAIVAYSPNGELLVAASRDTAVQVWTASDPAGSAAVFRRSGGDRLSALQFTPDGRTLVAATNGREVRRWNVADRALRPAPDLTAAGAVNAVVVGGDGRLVVGAGADGVTVWDTGTGRTVVLPGPAAAVSVAIGEQGAILVGDRDGVIRLWPARAASEQPAIGPNGVGVAAESSGRMVLRADSAQAVPQVWGAGSTSDGLDLLARLVMPADDPASGALAVTSDGSLAAVATRSGRIQLWDLSDPTRPAVVGSPIDAGGSGIDALAFGPTGTSLAVLVRDPVEVRLWDITIADLPHPLAGTGPIGRSSGVLAVDRRGDVLVVGSSDGRLRLWRLDDTGVVGEYPSLPDTGGPLAFAPTADLLAAVGADRTVEVFDMADPARPVRLAVLDGPADDASVLTFDSDGRRIIAGSGSGVWLWTVETTDSGGATFARLAVLGARYGRFTILAVTDTAVTDTAATDTAVTDTADTDTVSAVDARGMIRTWPMDPQRAEKALCESGSSPPTAEEWRRYLSDDPPSGICGRTS